MRIAATRSASGRLFVGGGLPGVAEQVGQDGSGLAGPGPGELARPAGGSFAARLRTRSRPNAFSLSGSAFKPWRRPAISSVRFALPMSVASVPSSSRPWPEARKSRSSISSRNTSPARPLTELRIASRNQGSVAVAAGQLGQRPAGRLARDRSERERQLITNAEVGVVGHLGESSADLRSGLELLRQPEGVLPDAGVGVVETAQDRGDVQRLQTIQGVQGVHPTQGGFRLRRPAS